ncbi:alpha/beta fold hydrolase [Leptolyngbya sp. FACHB-261]|uniref:alpha/beta fold hydrolase n=1 Tax=Leptolyngbya sp. FACHB-261 TaxID=2692806 RepID=UPI001681FF9F|nr:alpha/beta fold hydrolase [Leptolyngbya sp. FACHB-261]MBD2099374.1 alpha/beta fold hydrolase [Leptolyngbya sp. FACHB-261]
MLSCLYESDWGKLHYLDSGLDRPTALICLHGFTGSSRDFLKVPKAIAGQYRLLIPDLPGHGQTHLSEAAFETSAQVSLLQQWLEHLGWSRIHLLGYSMGGRLALQFAVRNPARLRSLILVSATAGIVEKAARTDRVSQDQQLADRLLSSKPEQFLYSWLSQPLFQDLFEQGESILTSEIQRRLPIQLTGLASSLRHFGSGAMPSTWHQLNRIQEPTLIVAGCKDAKYLELAHRLVASLPNSVLETLETGHSPIVGAPTVFWEQVANFLKKANVSSVGTC